MEANLEAQRTALRRLFWQLDVMQQMRDTNSTCHSATIPHTFSAAELMEVIFGSDPIEKQPDDRVIFMMAVFEIGDETWGAITAAMNYDFPLRIIEPFIIPDGKISNVALFKEEL